MDLGPRRLGLKDCTTTTNDAAWAVLGVNSVLHGGTGLAPAAAGRKVATPQNVGTALPGCLAEAGRYDAPAAPAGGRPRLRRRHWPTVAGIRQPGDTAGIDPALAAASGQGWPLSRNRAARRRSTRRPRALRHESHATLSRNRAARRRSTLPSPQPRAAVGQCRRGGSSLDPPPQIPRPTLSAARGGGKRTRREPSRTQIVRSP